MARRSFRDRFFTPRVARAILSPLGIVLLGAGPAAGILLGMGFAAPILGLGAWGARVVAAVPRRDPSDADIDAFVLSEPWKNYVMQAQNAKRRFDRTVHGTRPGPLRDRLQQLSDRLDDGLLDCWRVAQRGDEIDAAMKQLDVHQAERELQELKSATAGRTPSTTQDARRQSLESQIASFHRMLDISQETQERLRLIDARLDELVARSVEVSVGAGDATAFGDDIEDVVTELEALRLAQEETQNASRSSQPLPPPMTPATPVDVRDAADHSATDSTTDNTTDNTARERLPGSSTNTNDGSSRGEQPGQASWPPS
jgi:hypothetical protein